MNRGGSGVAYARGASQASKRATILLALDEPCGRNLDARVVIPAYPFFTNPIGG